jgi:hypothetical protein
MVGLRERGNRRVFLTRGVIPTLPEQLGGSEKECAAGS